MRRKKGEVVRGNRRFERVFYVLKFWRVIRKWYVLILMFRRIS